MANAVIIGHSYVRRLSQVYGQGRFHHRGPPDLHVKFFGVGGGRLTRVYDHRNLFGLIGDVRRERPDVIFVHAGENDLRGSDPQSVLHSLFQFVDSLAAECRPRKIIVGRLTKFPATPQFNSDINWINDQLKARYDNDHHSPHGVQVCTWGHYIGIAGDTRLQYYSDDDVHLNERGLFKYYRSIMTVVGGSADEIIRTRVSRRF